MDDVPGLTQYISLHPSTEVIPVAHPEKHPHTRKLPKVDPNPVSPRPPG